MIRKRMFLPEHIVKCGCSEGIGGDGMALAVVGEGGNGMALAVVGEGGNGGEGDVGRSG